MKKKLATAAAAAMLVGTLGLASPAGAGGHAPAHGKGCGFGEFHSSLAKAGNIGGDGHIPGSHRGASGFC